MAPYRGIQYALSLLLLNGCSSEVTAIRFQGLPIINGSASTHSGIGTVVRVNNGNGETSVCTGTLLNSRTVLTAAHCLLPAGIGSGDGYEYYYYPRNGIPSSTWGLNHAVRTFVHPMYIDRDEFDAPVHTILFGDEPAEIRTMQYDIAILHLERSEDGRTHAFSRTAVVIGEPVTIFGMGRTDRERDDGSYLRAGTNLIAGAMADIFYIWGGTEDRANICNGDSGGPTLSGETLRSH